MHWWTSLEALSKTQTAIAVIISLLGLFSLTVKLRADHLKKQEDTRRSDERARLDKRLEEKTAEALKTAAQLEMRQAPRWLTPSQKLEVSERLKSTPKGKVIVQANITDPEGRRFAEQIKGLLRENGYEILPVTLQLLAVVEHGAFLYVKSMKQPPPHAVFIQQALASVGYKIPAVETDTAMERIAPNEIPGWTFDENTLIIWIAQKEP